MRSANDVRLNDDLALGGVYAGESSHSGMSWAAIAGGAFAAIAISMLLLTLGSGIGLSTMSPWSNSGSLAAFSIKTAIWLIVMQWLSSAFGGYLTGRLRTKWANMHADEVFFRDTAHGFMAWAVATVVTLGFLTSAVSSVVSGGMQAASTVVAGTAAAGAAGAADNADRNGVNPLAYYVDSLYRNPSASPNASNADVTAETTRILVNGLKNGDVPQADRDYLAQMIAARTNLSPEEAQARVNDTINQAKEAEAKLKQQADDARKAGAKIAFFTFFSMLIGAFIASAAGALGGRHRDEL